jgi:hypothetical protein
MTTPPDILSGPRHALRRPNFAVLWVIVTVIWTVATVLRVQREWVPLVGWPAVLGGGLFWISVVLPPWMFAVILLAVKRISVGLR